MALLVSPSDEATITQGAQAWLPAWESGEFQELVSALSQHYTRRGTNNADRARKVTDTSGLRFNVIGIESNAARIRVSGSYTVETNNGAEQTEYLDTEWWMMREDGKWKWWYGELPRLDELGAE